MDETQKKTLIELLREMDTVQVGADEAGASEVAWYYYRDRIEFALGLSRGSLDTYQDDPEAQR